MEVNFMLYCFDKNLTWKEIKISKANGNGILYDNRLKIFLDFDDNIVDITDKTIFFRTGVAQGYEMIEQIIKQGGIPIISKHDIDKVEHWPKYYHTDRRIQILQGKQLINPEIVQMLENVYGQEIFIKTMKKNFSSVIPIELLKDKDCVFYKALRYHLDDEFFVSEKVEILEDKYGKKEYRCFIVNGQIYNISRITKEIFHKIDASVLEKLQEIVQSLKGIFPENYVVDLFEYQSNNQKYIDVVEFNPIYAAGLYLYNSCMEKSDDLLHENVKAIASEFMDSISKCKDNGFVINSRNDSHNLYNVPNSFSNDLRSVYMYGRRGGFCNAIISVSDFKNHEPIFDLESAEIITDDNFDLDGDSTFGDCIEEDTNGKNAKQFIKQLDRQKK